MSQYTKAALENLKTRFEPELKLHREEILEEIKAKVAAELPEEESNIFIKIINNYNA